jgi:pyridoxamine 5'-phosphate oxidase
VQELELDGAEDHDPIAWFQRSFAKAAQSEPVDATRMALATADASGRPAVRFVLLKQLDARGFTFFTNLGSSKARDMRDNPRAALAFHWPSIGEQIRVQGAIELVTEEESDAYFASRPRGSQLGAWASSQSAAVASRAELDARYAAVQLRFPEGSVVPRPAHWGGLRLVPESIEFWHERRDRLHDRWLFTRDGVAWLRTRLQP